MVFGLITHQPKRLKVISVLRSGQCHLVTDPRSEPWEGPLGGVQQQVRESPPADLKRRAGQWVLGRDIYSS